MSTRLDGVRDRESDREDTPEPPTHDEHLLNHAKGQLDGARRELAQCRYLRRLEDTEHDTLTKGDLYGFGGGSRARKPGKSADARPATLWDVAHAHTPPQGRPLSGNRLTARISGLVAAVEAQQAIVDEQEALKATHDEWVKATGVTPDTVKDPANLPGLVSVLDSQVQDLDRRLEEIEAGLRGEAESLVGGE